MLTKNLSSFTWPGRRKFDRDKDSKKEMKNEEREREREEKKEEEEKEVSAMDLKLLTFGCCLIVATQYFESHELCNL